jgi:hypothetical protein
MICERKARGFAIPVVTYSILRVDRRFCGTRVWLGKIRVKTEASQRKLYRCSGRNYDEAIRLSREGIRQRSDFVGAHRVLTAAAGMAGQTDIARVALQELRRAQPNISLAWIRKPNADQAGSRPGALFGRLPSRGLGLASVSDADQFRVPRWVPSERIDQPTPIKGAFEYFFIRKAV